MRKYWVGLLISLAFAAGCVAGTRGMSVPDANAEGAHAVLEQRWAYFCFAEDNVEDVNFKANAAGARGWEMVAAAPENNQGSSIWCFRQPRP